MIEPTLMDTLMPVLAVSFYIFVCIVVCANIILLIIYVSSPNKKDNKITRETYWTANSYHGNNNRIKIKHLEDSHLVNIILFIRENCEEELRGRELMGVLYGEAFKRKLSQLINKGEYIPYISKTDQTLICERKDCHGKA